MKDIREITEPDQRFSTAAVTDQAAGTVRLMTIADHHAAIERISLLDAVSEPVRTVFERARNAFLYAWFVYDLTPLAEGQAFAALEMALSEKLLQLRSSRSVGLREQLQAAFDLGLFKDFRLPPEWTGPKADYFRQLSSSIRLLRNSLAHGSAYVNMPGAALTSLRTCADLINHIYKQ